MTSMPANTVSYVTRLTWTDAEGTDWSAQVRNGDSVVLSRRRPDPTSCDTSLVVLEMPKEAFVRICKPMCAVLEAVHHA